MKHLTEKELDRFMTKVTKAGDCWLWNGSLDKDGYGSFFLRGTNRRAHRVAYFGVNGAIPQGMVVNHTCRNRNCVNPQHLNCITVAENASRDSTSITYINSQKTHCKNGHPFDKVVVYGGKTQRICTVCDKERRSEAARKRRALGKEAWSI